MAFTQQRLTGAPYLIGPLQTSVALNAEIVRDLTDDLWLKQQIHESEGYALYIVNRRPDEDDAYWIEQARTPQVLRDDYVYVGWNGYWASRITEIAQGNSSGLGNVDAANSKNGRLGLGVTFGFVDESELVARAALSGTDVPCVPLSALAKKGITPQLGLLEDDILYNLSLLCKNVLEPVKAKYPGIVILSGFRQVNTGIGQHERGEAADILIPSAPDTLLYQVADFIAKTVQFDQLILNYSMQRTPWIHVSFSVAGLRREVLTRDFDDTFHAGLFLITAKTGEDRATAAREQAQYLTKIDTELQIIEKRQTALNPVIVIGDETTGDMGGVVADSEDVGIPDTSMGDYSNILTSVFTNGTAWDLTTLDGQFGCGAYTEAVVNALPVEWGHLRKSGAQIQSNGHAVDYVVYKSPTPLNNGGYYQGVTIIVGAGDIGARPSWNWTGAPVSEMSIASQGGWYR